MSLFGIGGGGKIRGRIICDGDSITEAPSDLLSERWPTIAAGLINGGRCDYVNSGVSGTTLYAMQISFTTDITPLYNARRRFDIPICFGGTNDLTSGDSAATTIARGELWLGFAQATYPLVGLATLIPRNVGGGAPQTTFDADRATYNAWVASKASASVFVLDFGAIDELQDYTSTTYFKEPPGGYGVHPTPAGQALIANVAATTINARLVA